MRTPGEQIDVWVIDAPLGQGGMGSVYRCHNAAASRILAAIKVLDLDTRNNPRLRARFIREAEILFALDHPNIVKVRNVRMDADPPYIEMEFVNGESLEDRIARAPLAGEEAQRILGPIAQALQYLHERGIRHRDIKPSNIVIQLNEIARLVDFGIATEIDRGTVSEGNQALGSAWYVPPEWVRPNELDPVRWDIYAFGVVLFEALTGQSAFPVPVSGTPGQRFLQVLMAKQGHAPLDPGPNLPVDLRALVRDMTVPDPLARVQTAAEVAERLRGVDLNRVDASWRFTPPLRLDTATWTGEDSSVQARAGAPMHSRPPSRVALAPEGGGGMTAVAEEPTPIPVIPPQVEQAPVPRAPAASARLSSPTLVSEERPHTTASGSGGRSPWLVAAGALAFAGVVTALVLAFALSRWLAPVSTRVVDVAVTEVPAGLPLSVKVGEQAARYQDGLYRVEAMPAGPTRVRVQIGDGCAERGGVHCGAVELETEIVEGAGSQVIALVAPTPGKSSLTVSAPVPSFTVKLGDAPSVAGSDGTAAVDSLVPGVYMILVEAGACPTDVQGCESSASCPPGCSSWKGEVVVPWVGGSHRLEAPLGLAVTDTPPAPPGTASAAVTPTVSPGVVAGGAGSPAKVADPAPLTGAAQDGGKKDRSEVGTAPAEAPSGKAGALVGTSQLARWLSSNPEWQIGGEKAGGEGYLAGWTGSTPPAGAAGPAVDVSWALARAYCGSRGGLADIEAEPSTWTLSDSQPWHELRDRAGTAAWRRNDGSVSKSLSRNETMPEAGFRCVK